MQIDKKVPSIREIDCIYYMVYEIMMMPTMWKSSTIKAVNYI
jgi:hypothetical protein